MCFGERLKTLRNKMNMTQKELAEKVGVSRATIAGYETKGKKPPHQTLIELSKALDYSIDYLLDNPNQSCVKEDRNTDIASYYSDREDLQQLFVLTEKLSPDSVNRITSIIEIINEEVEYRLKSK